MYLDSISLPPLHLRHKTGWLWYYAASARLHPIEHQVIKGEFWARAGEQSKNSPFTLQCRHPLCYRRRKCLSLSKRKISIKWTKLRFCLVIHHTTYLSSYLIFPKDPTICLAPKFYYASASCLSARSVVSQSFQATVQVYQTKTMGMSTNACQLPFKYICIS